MWSGGEARLWGLRGGHDDRGRLFDRLGGARRLGHRLDQRLGRALLDEARVNRLRYLDGTEKGATRWIDTGWPIAILAAARAAGVLSPPSQPTEPDGAADAGGVRVRRS